MPRRKVDNKTVDAIGRKLFERDLLSVDEIDRIIDQPGLFELVNQRIAALEPASTAPGRRSWNWIPALAGSFASLAILAVLAAAVIDRNSVGTTKPAVTYTQIPDAAPGVARPDDPPKPVVTKLSAGRAPLSDDTGVRAEKAAYRRPESRVANLRTRPAAYEPEAEFYPVAYTGDPAETAGGGRIIRVDLNRSALFALGIDVPLENDRATVRADLLVGMDGVTRAVRLVE